ncbi:uncharacterized protein EV420DRAFT_1652615 [Desarmillaria tabescens]|uniref:Uncharacterized protein n=1 Tax=Armillaria tabescens TaxID=1929756 RepID=A0AA39J6T9_ARMTA|nr:uncharacterized protein EV420DRAFT_1652615 [Desarmillaria tabescens]KAK0436316.1 hypothetical protein EV420DRAFT_1652615 [Desarmillaria tabescens]
MPTCKCNAYGCINFDDGVILDNETARQHAIDDNYQYASQIRDAALEATIEDVTAYLASTTLSDMPFQTSQSPGGRAWARSYPKSEDQRGALGDEVPAPFLPPPRYTVSDQLRKQRIQVHLDHLCAIEQSLTRLITDGLPRLQGASFPTGDSYHPWPFSDLEQGCDSIRRGLTTTTVNYKDVSVLAAKDDIIRHIQSFSTCVQTNREAWERGKPVEDHQAGIRYNTDHHFEPILGNARPTIQIVLFTVLAMNIILNVGRRNILTASDRALLHDFPTDIRISVEKFRLDSKCTIYAVCPNPQCHFTYKPVFHGDSPVAHYPTYCQYKRYKGSPRCNARLTRPKRLEIENNEHQEKIEIPIKPFVSFDFKDWLGSLLSRKGFEENMDAAWDAARVGGVTQEMRDIFDSQILHEFKGPDGLHFSIGNGEGRYVFSLSFDSFNP